MKRTRAIMVGWLVWMVVALCPGSVLGQGSGDTPGSTEYPDYTSCVNNPKWTCGCPCDTYEFQTDCVADESDKLSRCYSPSGVILSVGESFALIDDDGPNASPTNSSCTSCSTDGKRIPGESQLPRVRLQRIWRSGWVERGSFGLTMYTGYDYVVRRSVQNGFTIYYFVDPNTGNSADEFRDEGGGVYVPVGPVDYHTRIAEATDTHITFVKLDGRRFRFEWTGYFQNGAYARARLQHIEDRNGNRISFSYLRPAADTTPDVFMWDAATDSYGRSLQFSYITWQGENVVGEVTLPGGQRVTYRYDEAVNPYFAYKVEYGEGVESTWAYDNATKIHWRNEALLPADHFQQTILTSHFVRGRTRYIKRADGTLLYSRTDQVASGEAVTTMYDRGETFEIKSGPVKTLISHRQQRVDGTWEEWTNYEADDTRPVKEVHKPDGRNWDAQRYADNDRISIRRYPDGSSESFTYNEFAQMTGHVHRSGAVETWSYDAAGNLRTHTEAAGVAGVEATESWTYNGRGQVLTHTDFNGNTTRYDYYPNGDLERITLPAGTGQPSGAISYVYDSAGRVRSTTDPGGRTVAFGYDAAGRLTATTYGDSSTEETTYGTGQLSARMNSTKDRNGNLTLYDYDDTGRVLTTRVQDARTGDILSTTTNTWDAPTGRLMAVDRYGDRTEHTYDYKGRVLTTTVYPQPSRSLTTTNSYDQYHLVSTKDPYGRRTFYVYDQLDRVTRSLRETVPGGVPNDADLSTLPRNPNLNAPYLIEDSYFDSQARRTAHVDTNGVRYEYVYDARDRLVLERSAVGAQPPVYAEERHTYDGNNNRLTMTDKNGRVWRKTYTARNTVRTEADPLGNTYTYAYYADGLRETETNPNGHTTRFIYDTCCGLEAGGRLTEVIDADGNSVGYEYDANGNRASATDQGGRVVRYEYDGLNRQTRAAVDPTGLNLQTTTVYDQTPGDIGREMRVTSPAGQVIRTKYDGLGRVERVHGDTPEMTYTYDVLVDGYLKTTITVAPGTADEKSRSSLADGVGRTVRTIDGVSQATHMFYDNNSNLKLVVDRDGQRTSYDYDARDRRVGMVEDEGAINATTRYEYDAVGNLLQITDPEGKVTRYAYDNADRRTAATYAFGTGEAKTWGYAYGPMGQLRQLAKPNGVRIKYAYDNLERLSARSYSSGGIDTFTYHANSLLKRAVGGLYNTVIDRSNLNQDYDRANRLLQERQNIGAGPKTVAYSYHPDSLVNQITYPGNTQVDQTYTNRRELQEVKLGTVAQATHTYDAAGRPKARAYANGRTTAWVFDDNDRVTNLNHADVQAWDYRYTPEDDMLVQDDRTTPDRGEAYAYDGLHRLRDNKRGQVVENTVPTPTFRQGWTLDKVGNWTVWDNNSAIEGREHNNHHALTRRGTFPTEELQYDANGNQLNGGLFTFVYDAEDRLRRVRNQFTGGVVAGYRYDAFGRRVEKLISDVPNRVVRYYYSDQRIIEERNGNDAVQATYTYGNYIDEPLTMDRGGDRFYYHSNRLFTTYALTSADGEIVERYTYTPYGEMMTLDAAYQIPQLVSRVGNTFTFTGRELDAETGLMHFRARQYSPMLGRFVSRDPKGYSEGWSLYTGYFVPNRLDPAGLKSEWLSVGRGAVGNADTASSTCDCWEINARAQADGSTSENLRDPWNREVTSIKAGKHLGSNVNITTRKISGNCCCPEVGWAQYFWSIKAVRRRLTYEEGIDRRSSNPVTPEGWFDPTARGGHHDWLWDYPGVDAANRVPIQIIYFKSELKCTSTGKVVATVFWYNVSGLIDNKPVAGTGGHIICGSDGGWGKNPFKDQIESMREGDGTWVRR